MARCLLPIPLSPRHSCVCLYEDLSNSPSTPLPPTYSPHRAFSPSLPRRTSFYPRDPTAPSSPRAPLYPTDAADLV